MKARILKQNKKMEVVNYYKSYISKLGLEKEDLKREVSRNMHKQTQLGGRPQSLQPALQFIGQVADDSPRFGQQAGQIAAFEPDVEKIDLEDLEEEDFAPPPANNSRRETLQVQQVSGGSHRSFGGVSSSKLQVRVEKVDME